jgi:N-acetylglucosamine kinase-like BadF-type ATPase
MNKYIIAIDGGGTKTLGVLYNLDGVELKRVTFGFSNFSIDEFQAKENIFKTIETLLKDIDPHLVHVEMGISGASKLLNQKAFINDIESTFHVKASLETDVMSTLYGIEHNQEDQVILVIAGTGSAIVIKEGDYIETIGGYGHMLGDEGSGYHVSIQAIKRFIYQIEHDEKLSCLSLKIADVIGSSSRTEIIKYLYAKNKTEIADIAKTVVKADENGCEEAKQLLIEEGLLIANQILRVLKKFKTNNKVVIALRGGFILHASSAKHVILESIDKHIKHYEIDTKPIENVYGAYKLGLIKILKEVKK